MPSDKRYKNLYFAAKEVLAEAAEHGDYSDAMIALGEAVVAFNAGTVIFLPCGCVPDQQTCGTCGTMSEGD